MYLPKIIGRWVVVFCFATNLAVGAVPEPHLPKAENVEQQLRTRVQAMCRCSDTESNRKRIN